MKSKKLFFLFTLLFIQLILNKISYSEIVIEKIVARVNDSIITLSEFENFYEDIKKEEKKNVNKKDILKLLIERELLFQLAREYDVEASEDEIRMEIEKEAKKNSNRYKDSKSKYYNNIYFVNKIKLNKNRENLVRYIAKNNLIMRPSEKEIKKVYKEHRTNFYEKEQFLVSHILIRLSRNDSYDLLEEKEKLVKQIVSLIQNKKDSFTSLAKKYSDDLDTKYKGGLIGWHDIESLSEIQENIASTTLELKIGQVSDIIISASGYHIIKLLDKKEERQISFIEAKQFILNKLLLEKAQEHLLKMIEIKEKQSYIDNYL